MTLEDEVRSTGMQETDLVEVNGDESMMEVLRLCDTRRKLETEDEFVRFWSDVRKSIANFLHVHPTYPRHL